METTSHRLHLIDADPGPAAFPVCAGGDNAETQQTAGKRSASPTSPSNKETEKKRKGALAMKKSRLSKEMGKATKRRDTRILCVVADTCGVKYTVFENGPALSESYLEWIAKPGNNDDVLAHLLPNGHGNNASIVNFKNTKKVDADNGKVSYNLEGVSTVLCFEIGKKIRSAGLVEVDSNPLLRFTLATTFDRCVKKFKDSTAEYIDEHFDLVFLSDTSLLHYKSGQRGQKENVDSIYEFCASSLTAKSGVRVFPPVSILWFLEQKSRRDQLLEKHMLPSVAMSVKNWNNDTAAALVSLKSKYENNQLVLDVMENGLVAKPSRGGGSVGVLFLKYFEGSWVPYSTCGEQQQDKCTRPSLYQFQPFVANCRARELRIVAHPVANGSGRGLTIMYAALTSLGHTGEVTVDRMYPAIDKKEKEFEGFSSFAGKVLSTVAAYGRHPWNDIQGLPLRIDCFKSPTDNKIYLNELGVLPSDYSFLDGDFIADKNLEMLVETITNHLVKFSYC